MTVASARVIDPAGKHYLTGKLAVDKGKERHGMVRGNLRDS